MNSFSSRTRGDGAVAAVGGLAPAQAAGRVGGQEVLALGPGGEGDQGGQVQIPGGGRGEIPALHHRGVLLGSQLHDGVARAGDGGQAKEGVSVAERVVAVVRETRKRSTASSVVTPDVGCAGSAGWPGKVTTGTGLLLCFAEAR